MMPINFLPNFWKTAETKSRTTLIFGPNCKKRPKNVPTECSTFTSTLSADKKFCRNSKKAPKILTLRSNFLPNFQKTAEFMRYGLFDKFKYASQLIPNIELIMARCSSETVVLF